jgi:hypothetical protein
MDTDDGRPPAPDAAKDLARRRRARNWALLLVLLSLSALFYAITLVKLAKGG